jgi:hypothetical protein
MRYQLDMCRTIFKLLCVLFILCAFLAPRMPAQLQSAQSPEDNAYAPEFFNQLRAIFGKFRDADLQRVFEEAKSIQCSELIAGKGEWRTVAFFNENRVLGEWCFQNLQEVKSELAVYKFTGSCGDDKARIRVATEYPTEASVSAYNNRQIEFKQIDITANAPVDVALNPKTMAYMFDLPYLYLRSEFQQQRVYSLVAPDRNAFYANDAVSHWECKLAVSKDVTYRFLICRMIVVPRGPAPNNGRWKPSFGSAGYFILSDGMKAQASVNLSFGDKPSSTEKPPVPESDPKLPPRPILIRPEP